MRVVRTAAELRAALEPARQAGLRIGLVPTMGSFHEGHLSLMRIARDRADVVVVSLFVNPAQFGPAEDLARYPRGEERDVRLAEEVGVDVLFVPPVDEVYPPGFDTWIDPGGIATVLEGASRPGHFRGVATVCVRLFNLVAADLAVFGRKDAQQVAVIRQVVRDLALPVEIAVAPTVRDADGLALSSRNDYLAPEERVRALALPRALEAGRLAHRSGVDPVETARAVLEGADGVAVDYVAVADLDGPTLAAAIRVGGTRLIDNVALVDNATDTEDAGRHG